MFNNGEKMETIKKLIPTIISIVAIIISISSIYLTSLKPPTITLSVGESMQVWHNANKEVNIDLPIIFHNSGSQSGVIRSLGIIFKDPNSEESMFIKWLGFKKYEDKVEGRSAWIYESTRTPLAVPPAGEVSKMVNFYSEKAGVGWIPKPITYDIYLLAWDTGSETPTIRQKISWTYREADVSEIKRRLEEGQFNGTWILHSSYAAESRKLTTLEFNRLTNKE